MRPPLVVDDQLTASGKKIRVGSRAWFAWLEADATRSFAYQTAGVHLTVRREKISGGAYWYAYRTHRGKLQKTYLGKTAELTRERLQTAVKTLDGKSDDNAAPHLEFFGVTRITRDGAPVRLNPKSIALLAYLAAQSAPVAREKILELFWQASAPEAARKNLRNLLWQIRTLLSPDLVEGVQELELNKAVACDVCAFRQAQRELARPAASLRALQTIRKLYHGEFLDGFALDDSPEFEVWLTGVREQFHETYLDALQNLVRAFRAHGKWKQVGDMAHAVIVQDSLQEPMYRALMEAHAQLGDRVGALRHYDALRETLERELGVEPLPETQELRAAIVNGTLSLRKPEPDTHRAPAVERKRSALPFVGRSQELAALDHAWREAQRGNARVVLFAGEAGIGKSRLWETWQSSLDPHVTVAAARALPTTSTLPFAPLVDLLRSPASRERFAALAKTALPAHPAWLADIARLTPELRELLPQIGLPPLLPPVEEQRHLFEALVMGLGISDAQPSVLFMDDLQWADRSTLDWLGYLLFRARAMPFLFVGAYRAEEAAPPLVNLIAQWKREGIADRLVLERLTRDESAALIRALQGDVSRAENLYAQSAGNPYFILELLRAAPGSIPAALTDLIQARVQRLGDAPRQVLQAAAVLQAELTFPILQYTAGRTDDETLDALDSLHEAGLVTEQGGQYALSHPLIAAVIDRGLGGARRSRLHRRAAEALERAYAGRLGEIAGRLLWHYAQAGEPARAAQYAELAAERALALAAPGEAVQLYERAISLDPTPLREFGLGGALMRAGDFPRGRAVYEHALAQFDAAGDAMNAARVCMEIARSFLSTGQAAQVIVWIQRGRAYLPENADPATQVVADYLLGTELRAAGTDLQESEEHFRRALALARNGSAPQMIADILMELGNTLAQRGNLPDAIACYREMIAHAQAANEQNQQIIGYNNLAYHLLLAGEIHQAHAAIEQALELADATDVQMARQWLYSTRGEVALAEQDWQAARDWFERGMVIADRFGNHEQVTNYEMNLALAARGRGALDDAVLILEKARGNAHAPFLHAQIELWLTQVYFERGELAAAQQALARADAHVSGSPFEALKAWANRLRKMLQA